MTTTSAPIQVEGDTVKANDIVLRLDQLAQGYSEVLEMAKQQLENFEISEDDWSRIHAQVARRVDYYDVASAMSGILKDGLCAIEISGDSAYGTNVVLARQVIHRLRDILLQELKGFLISIEVKEIVDQQMREMRATIRADIEAAVKDQIQRCESDTLRSARDQQYHFKGLLQQCFADDLKQTAREVILEMQMTPPDSWEH